MKSIHIQQILLNQLQVPAQLLTSYKSLGLDEREVMLLIQIHRFIYDENEFPTPQELAEYVTMDEQTCSKLLRTLIQKGLLAIGETHDKQNKLSEYYSLDPLWDKIYAPNEPETEMNEEGTIFILFEQEFGRPLSPFEIETINVWLDEDNIVPALIKAALRESVLMGKLNFKYIDRILRDWKQKGIKSVEEAREISKNFHQKQKSKVQIQSNKKRDTSFYYNWLEGDD